MVTSLFKHDQIETTDTKAKQLRPVAEKMITLAKKGDLHARRQALSYMRDKGTIHRLFEEANDRYNDRQGGYVRIVKKGNRKGDGAPMSVIQLIFEGSGKKKGEKKKAVSKAGPGKGGERKKVKAQRAETAKKGTEEPVKEKESGKGSEGQAEEERE